MRFRELKEGNFLEMKLVILLIVMAILAMFAMGCAGSLPCPIHDYSTGYFTGTKLVDGVLVGVYHCPRGHDFLARCN